MSLPLISIIILSLNKKKFTQFCLTSLISNTTYPNWELIVVDNGSTDGSVEWMESECKRIADSKKGLQKFLLIKNTDNKGCSTARNQGIDASQGEYIVFCDNDILVRSCRWLEILVRVFLRNKNIGAVCPKLLYPIAPYNIQCAGVGISPNGRVVYYGRGEDRENPEYNKSRNVQAAISACLMSKKDILLTIKGFDEIFNPIEYEDIDLCYKIKSKGFFIRYEPGVEMYHFENVTSEGTPHLHNTYLIIKHGLVFKKRWRHVFEKEYGPPPVPWKNIIYNPPDKLDSIPLIF